MWHHFFLNYTVEFCPLCPLSCGRACDRLSSNCVWHARIIVPKRLPSWFVNKDHEYYHDCFYVFHVFISLACRLFLGSRRKFSRLQSRASVRWKVTSPRKWYQIGLPCQYTRQMGKLIQPQVEPRLRQVRICTQMCFYKPRSRSAVIQQLLLESTITYAVI